jgi:IS4 transposase
MNIGKTVFSQLMDFAPAYQFRKCVARYHGEYKVRAFSCWNQYLCMAFAQLTYRESLRDIEACLRSVPIKLYHLGIRGTVARNTLAHANAVRDWHIYADFAQVLIQETRSLYAGEELAVRLEQTVYALDSTTIDLCLALFPWAKFRRRKAAVKMHTLFDVRASVPTLVIITHGKVHDVRILDELVFEAGGLYVMDRGYLDFARLHRIQEAGAFFVTRAKKNFRCERLSSQPVNKASGVQCDQTVRLRGFYSRRDYPDKLRRIRYRDAATGQRLVFLTNNFALPAEVIATVYRYRWRVELFFKWIKQHLRIKAFYGTSENAVKTQIWIAISVYVLVAIVKKRLKVEQSLYTILQILSVTLFQKTPISQTLSNISTGTETSESHNQLILFK